MNRPKHPKAQQFVGQKLFDGLVCFRDLETRIEHLPTEQQRGDAFEVFAEAYFATQRIEKAKHVWPDKKISPSLRAKLKLHLRDVGADGVIETVAGKYRGYQAKFRTGRTPLTWTEVATFFGVTDHCDDRLLFTNSEDVSEVTDERKDFSSIRGTDLDSLGTEDFDAIRSWLEGGQVVRETHPPRPYQQQALDAILPALKQKQDRATAVMACGTGKTFVALWVAEAIAKRTVLVLVPSLALLRQTLREWVNNTTWERFDYLCVCSDPTVSQGGDELIVRPTELEFSVSTKPEQVREFLAHSFAGVKIVFSTYQSADVVARGMPRDLQFDIGIFDEAHKTAGREGAKFSFALKDENLPIRKRLFLTATPRHYDLRKRDKEGEPVEVYSMNRPEIYGPVVHTLSFAEAAKQKIICNYKVVISVVTSAMLDQQQLRHGTVLVGDEEVKTPQVANQIALAQAVTEHQLKKIFTFHRNVASARSFTSGGSEGIGTHLPDFAALHVNGAMSTAARDGLMSEFKAAREAVISNARCLTEGIDVPTVDMVAFMSPKRSKVDIVQAVGRAMRTSRETGKTTGYILIPLYVEQAKGESLDAAVARAEFDEVWAVLQAMQEQDEVLAEIIGDIAGEIGRIKGFDDGRFREKVEVLGPTVRLEQLRSAITTLCIHNLGAVWNERFGELQKFKDDHGHCNVTKDLPAYSQLWHWVVTQRANNKQGRLGVERVARLDALGFIWDPHTEVWEEMFALTQSFKALHDHCSVPQKWPDQPKLARWVMTQRRFKKAGKLSPERIARLEALGFTWNQHSDWDEMFVALQNHKATYGNCDVPGNWPHNPQLANWARHLRNEKRLGRVSPDRVERLDAIGFVWSRLSGAWETKFESLQDYKSQHGNCNVPNAWPDNQELAYWVAKQRHFKRRGGLSQERIRRLEAIGFDWGYAITPWEETFAALEDFNSKHGHCNVPKPWPDNPKLANWVRNQRTAKRQGILSPERVTLLDSLGFRWNQR